MGLNYPNRSRFFDSTAHVIRFWGYDSAIEVSFFMDANALRKFSPKMTGSESDILNIFDSSRDQIHQVADKVYFCRPKGSYRCNLAAEDF